MTDDPWATAEATTEDDTQTPASETEVDEFDLLLGALEEEESGEEIRVRDEGGKPYDNPYDVGLETGMWVPVRILTAGVKEKYIPRLNAKVCVAVKDGKTVAVLADKVEQALKSGATEEIRDDLELPYFVAQANHAAPRFGRRRFNYDIEVPVFTVKTAIHNMRPGSTRTGFANEDGRSLRVATGVMGKGDKLTAKNPAPEGYANMHDVAEKMDDQIVLAKVTVSQAKRPKMRPVLDGKGEEITVLVDPESGSPVKLFKADEDSPYVHDDGSGKIWEGDESLLYQIDDRLFVIRDAGELSDKLTEQYFPINDYINPPFLPLPERRITIERAKTDANGEAVQVEGEITLDTIGAIARGNVNGVAVDALLLSGEDVGKTITATWIGTQWVERPSSGASEGDDADQFVGSQKAALASL